MTSFAHGSLCTNVQVFLRAGEMYVLSLHPHHTPEGAGGWMESVCMSMCVREG